MKGFFSKRTILISICLVAGAILVIMCTFAVPGKRAYVGTSIEKNYEIGSITGEEVQEKGETEMMAEKEQDEFPNEMEVMENSVIDVDMERKQEIEGVTEEQNAMEAEMAKREKEEFEKEMERMRKEQEDLEDQIQ